MKNRAVRFFCGNTQDKSARSFFQAFYEEKCAAVLLKKMGKNEKNQLDFLKELAYDNYENDNQSQIRLRNVDKEKTIRRVI